MNDQIELEMRATYGHCKWLWGCVVKLWVVSALLTAASAVADLEVVASSLGLLLAIATYGVRWSADMHYQTAEQLRRMRLMIDGLGEQAHPAEVARIRAAASDRPSKDPLPIGSYYTSQYPMGWRRVLHNILESAFYTEHLARRTGWLCAMGGGTVILVALVAMVCAAERAVSPVFANAALGLITAVISGTLADLARAYFALAAAASGSFDRAKGLVERGEPPLREALEAVGDYNVALSNAPPIPGFVYGSMRTRLDGLWKHVRSS